jgi:chromosome segregation ATPase
MESENKAWQSNLDAAKNLKAEYPVFATLIDLKITEATKLWTEASNLSKEDEKVKKMVAANDLLDNGCIGNLQNMKSKISDLKSKKESLMELKTKDNVTESRVQTILENVEDAVKKAEKVIYMSASDYNIQDAPGKIDIAFNKLTDTYREVEIMIDNINKENQSIANDKAQKEQEVKDQKDKAEEAVKDIKCTYCGTMNSHDYSKCKSCGAPKE